MPEDKGLYWARVGEQWFVVNWTGCKNPFGRHLEVQAILRNSDGMRLMMTTLRVEEVTEWGARITEPGEG